MRADHTESDTKASSNRPPLPAKPISGKPPKNRFLQKKVEDMEKEAGEKQQREARFKRRQE